MGREVVLFSSKERKGRVEIGAFLRDLADRLETGHVTLRTGETEIALELPDALILEIKVEDEDKRHKGTQHSLEVELKWYDGMAQAGGIELG